MLDVMKPALRNGLALVLSVLFLPAGAVSLDFRDGLFRSAQGQSSFTTSISDITFTLTASDNASLWWDSIDGLGISFENRDNEIGGNEYLLIQFQGPINLSSISVTNLFDSRQYMESGSFSTASTTETFYAAAGQRLGQSNGELQINGDYSNIDFIQFQAAGRLGSERHEFSLAGLEVSLPATEVSAVPVPAALWLFGSGLIVLGGLLHSKQRRL